MADSLSPLTLTSGLSIFRQTDFNGTKDDATFGSAATTLRLVKIDNSANASQSVYGKFVNTATYTVGTTAPDMIIPVAGGATVNVAILGGSTNGYLFATALSDACVTTGGTAGTTGPTSDVVLAMVASV